MLWSAAEAAQPAGLTQLSIYLAADRPAAEIKLLVESWLWQQQGSSAARLRSATVTVRQVGSALLHLLFYMPEGAQTKLVGTIHEMSERHENARCLNFEEDCEELMALTAMKHMLREQGLAPENWRLSTAVSGREWMLSLCSQVQACLYS